MLRVLHPSAGRSLASPGSFFHRRYAFFCHVSGQCAPIVDGGDARYEETRVQRSDVLQRFNHTVIACQSAEIDRCSRLDRLEQSRWQRGKCTILFLIRSLGCNRIGNGSFDASVYQFLMDGCTTGVLHAVLRPHTALSSKRGVSGTMPIGREPYTTHRARPKQSHNGSSCSFGSLHVQRTRRLAKVILKVYNYQQR